MEEQKQTPASRVISAFGGVRATARILDVASSTVSRWQKAREHGGTGGKVPTKHMREVLDEAKRRGLHLSAEDLI